MVNFRLAFFHNTTNIIHKGIFVSENWINDKYIYHQKGVSLNDTGMNAAYQ